MSNASYNQGKQTGNNNPHQQQATPQQIPNAIQRDSFNKGLSDWQKK